MSRMRECCFRSIPKDGRKLVWEITHRCTFNCDYCFQEKKRLNNPIRVLAREDLLKICLKLPKLNVSEVLITGGEIFFIKDMVTDICSVLESKEISFSFSTSFINQKDFINLLFSSKPRTLNISFDPSLTGKNFSRLDKEINNIEYVLKMGDLNEVQIKITGVVNRNNVENIDEYITVIKGFLNNYKSLASVYITNPYDIGYVKTGIRASNEKLKKILGLFKKNAYPKIKFVNFPRFNMPLQQCMAGTHIMHMEPDGNIYPCHLLANYNPETFLMGNALTENINDVEERLSDFGGQIGSAISEYKSVFKQCRSCRSLEKCGGGCLAEIVSVGQLIEPQLVCKKIPPPKKTHYYKPPDQKYFNFIESPIDLRSEEEEKIIEYIKTNIRKRKHDLAHGYDHVECVVNLARFLAKAEGANLRIVSASAYFHDFAPRQKLLFEGHTKLSAQLAVNFLKGIGFSKNDLERVYHCIDTSSYGSSELGYNPLSLEAKVIRDADWLEAIGARGIARVFAFAAAHNCEVLGEVEWNLSDPPKKRMSLIGPDPSPIYHFYSKLLWIKDKILTDTGKKIAKIRHKRLVDFLLNYKNEMIEDGFLK